jgi:hypothetical protein
MNGEKPYFHIEWIMDNIFKLSPEEKAENARYWAKDPTASGSAPEGQGVDQGGGGDIGGDIGGAQGGAQAPPVQGGAQAPPAQGPAQGGAQTPPAQGGAEFEF